MYQQAPDLEQRLTELQAEIEQLNLSLHLLRQTQDRQQPTERRLTQLTERCADMLGQITLSDARHAQAITEGFERADARLAAVEAEFYRRIEDVSRQMLGAIGELRSGPNRSLPGSAPAWPLEGVMRLHQQVRSGESPASAPPVAEQPAQGDSPAARSAPARPLLPESVELSNRVESLERALSDGQAEIKEAAERSDRTGRKWRLGLVALGIGIVAVGGFVWRLERQVGAAAARVVTAERQAQTATEAANRQMAEARDSAAQQIADARATALKAQTISDVLAAPDMIRFNLVGGQLPARFTAQALWSRSRGLVFSGSRLPSAPSGSTYQIWILTAGEPVSAGVFVPDASGRITIATDTPPRIARPVTGVTVTTEPGGGRDAPSGATLLARAQPQ